MADVATGTAAVAMSIAWRHGSRVIGIDQNEAMLARGRERVAATGLDGRVELVQGEAEALPLEDASVDALVHTYLLRYVDDPPGGAARAGPPDPPRRRDGIARVLRARGRLVSGLVGLDADRPARRGRAPAGPAGIAPAASLAPASSASGTTTRCSEVLGWWHRGRHRRPSAPSGCPWAAAVIIRGTKN